MYVNGALVNTNLSGTPPIGLKDIRFGINSGLPTNTQGYVYSHLIIPTAITDQEAIDLTTI